ncbi:MAG: hypothetical protein AAF840_06595 [Bacteroidota bacterium]
MSNEFWKYLRTQLTAEQWDDLAHLLNCSAHHLTKLRKGNKDFSFAEVETLAAILGEDPVQLSLEYGLCRDSQSLNEWEAFAHRHDQEFQYKAA